MSAITCKCPCGASVTVELGQFVSLGSYTQERFDRAHREHYRVAGNDQVFALVAAARNVLEYLDGMDIPYKDQHRPLRALGEALAPFGPTELKGER